MFAKNYSQAHSQSFGNFKLKMMFVFGLVVLSSACNMLSDVRRSFSDVEVMATVVDRTKTCILRTRPNGAKSFMRRKMDCEEAHRLRKEDPSLNARVYKKTYVVLSYPLANGRTVTSRVRERKVGARAVPIGGQVRVVYNANKPRSVRRLKSSSKIWTQIWYIVFGAFGLAAIIYGRNMFRALWKQLEHALEQSEQMRREGKLQQQPQSERTPYQPGTERPPTQRVKRKRHRTLVSTKAATPLGSAGGVVQRPRGLFGFAN